MGCISSKELSQPKKSKKAEPSLWQGAVSSRQERQGLAGPAVSSEPWPRGRGSGPHEKDGEAHMESAPADPTAGPALTNGEPAQQHAQLLLRVFDVEGLANLHPRKLQLLPPLVELLPHTGIGVHAAVERFWELRDMCTATSAIDERHLMLSSLPLFLQPITATAGAGTALGCAPTAAACGAALAHQLQQQHSRQPDSEAPLQHASLVSALQAVGSHVLRCTSAASAQAPPLPVLHSTSPHAPSLLSSSSSSTATIAQWGSGLRAAVLPAYHAASGGVLEPALVLEFNSTASAAQAHTGSKQQLSCDLRACTAPPEPAASQKCGLPANQAPALPRCSATTIQSIPSSRRSLSLHRNQQQHASSGEEIRASMLRLLAGSDVRSHHPGSSPASSTPFRQLTSNSEVSSGSKPGGDSEGRNSGTLHHKPHSGLSSFASTLFAPAQQSPSLSQWGPQNANLGARTLSSSLAPAFRPASEPLTSRRAHACDAPPGQRMPQRVSLGARPPHSLTSLPSPTPSAHQRRGTLAGRSSLDLGAHTLRAHTIIASSSLYAAHTPRASAARQSEESASMGPGLKPHCIRRSTESHGLPSLLEKQADLRRSESQAGSACTSTQSLPPRSWSTRARSSPRVSSALQREASSAHADVDVLPQARADGARQHQSSDLDGLEGFTGGTHITPSSQTSRQSPQLTPLRDGNSFRASRPSGTTVVSIHARALAVLDEVPVIATLLDVTGHVLYQNAASKEYHGVTLLSAQQSERENGNLPKSSDLDSLRATLELLLASNSEAVAELLHEVAEGFMWQRVLALCTPILPAESSFSRHKKLSNCSSFFGACSAHQGEQQAPPPQAVPDPLQSQHKQWQQQQQQQQQQERSEQWKLRSRTTTSASLSQPQQQKDQKEPVPLTSQQPCTPSGKARPRRSVTFSGIVSGKPVEGALSTGGSLSAHQLHAGSIELGPSVHDMPSTQQQLPASDQKEPKSAIQPHTCTPEVQTEATGARRSLLSAGLHRAEQAAARATDASLSHRTPSRGRRSRERTSQARGRVSLRGGCGSIRRRSSSTSGSRRRLAELRGHAGSWKLTRTGSRCRSPSSCRSVSATRSCASASSRGSSRASPCSARSSRSTPALQRKTRASKAARWRRRSSADAHVVHRPRHASRRLKSGAHRAQTSSSHGSDDDQISPSLLSMQGLCYELATSSKDGHKAELGRASEQRSSANQSPGSVANLFQTLSPEEDEAPQLSASTSALGQFSLPQTPFQPSRVVRSPSKLRRAGTSLAAEEQGRGSLDRASPTEGAAVPRQQSRHAGSKPSSKPPLRRHGSAALLQAEGGQQKTEGPNSLPCVSTRTTRSGLAVEPSTRVLSLMQGTSSKAQELGVGDPRSRAVVAKESAESKAKVRRIKAVHAQGQRDAQRQESKELDVSVSDSFSKPPSHSHSKFLQSLEPSSRSHTGSLQLEHPFHSQTRSSQLEHCRSLPGTLQGGDSKRSSSGQVHAAGISRLSGGGSCDHLVRTDTNECQSVFAFVQPPKSSLQPTLQHEPGPSPSTSEQPSAGALSRSTAALTDERPARMDAERLAQQPQAAPHKLQLRVVHEGAVDTSDLSYASPLLDRLDTESVAPESADVSSAAHAALAGSENVTVQDLEAGRGSVGSKAVAEEVAGKASNRHTGKGITEERTSAPPELLLPPAVPSGLRRLSQTISWPRADVQERQQLAQPQPQVHPGLLGEGAQQFLAQQSRGRAGSAAESEGLLRHQMSERLGAEDSMSNLFNVPSFGALPAEGLSWHEVQAMAITDPVSGHAALLLLQTDITQRAELEARMAALTESQLSMLEQMFPRHVLEYMVAQQPNQATDTATTASHLASSHEDVTILFTDIVGFTTMSKQVKPDQVMAYLNELFTAFDELVDTYQIYKVETAGDCYIAAGGLMMIDKDGFMCIDPSPDPKEAAERVLSFAKALLHCAKSVAMPHNGEPTTIRVGMHTGPAVTGLIGTKLPKFSVFGDTMNTCSRMESTCRYGCIQISETTNALLRDPGFKPTGGIEVKGKGRMNTFYWDPSEQKPEVAVPPDVAEAVACVKDAAPYGLVGADTMHTAPSLKIMRSGTNSGLPTSAPRRGSMLSLHYHGEPSAPDVSELLSTNTVSVSSPQVPCLPPDLHSSATASEAHTPTCPPSPRLPNLTSLHHPIPPTQHPSLPATTRAPPPVRTQPSLHSPQPSGPGVPPLVSPLLRRACSTLNRRRHSHSPFSSQDDMAPALRACARRRRSELSPHHHSPVTSPVPRNRGLGGPSKSCDAGLLVPPASPTLQPRHNHTPRHTHALLGSSQPQNAYARLALLKHQSHSSSSTSQPGTCTSSAQPSTLQTSLSALLHPHASQPAPSHSLHSSQAQYAWHADASPFTQSPPPISRTPSPALPPLTTRTTTDTFHAATQPAQTLATSHSQLAAPSLSSMQDAHRVAAVPTAPSAAEQQGHSAFSAAATAQGGRSDFSAEAAGAAQGPAGQAQVAHEAAAASVDACQLQQQGAQGVQQGAQGAQQGSLLPPLSEQGNTMPGQGPPQPQQYSSPRFRRPPRRQASCFASLVPALQQEAALQKASAAYVAPSPWQTPGPTSAAVTPPPLRSTTQALMARAPPGTLPDPLSEIRASSSFTHPSGPSPRDGSSTAPAAASHAPNTHPSTGYASALAQFGTGRGRRGSAGWHALTFSDAAHGTSAWGCGPAGHPHNPNPWSLREAAE